MSNDRWIDLAVSACLHTGIKCNSIETIATWDKIGCANAVYQIDGNRYLKIFGPGAEWQYYVEVSVLRTLALTNKIPAPNLITHGLLASEHPYLIMAGVAGATMEALWDTLSRTEQLRLARELGHITRAIHDLSTKALESVEQIHGGMQQHTKRYHDRHVGNITRSNSVSAKQQETLVYFIDVEAIKHLQKYKVLTHFDMAHNHIFLEKDGDMMAISGIIDWGEATLGPPEWDISYLWFWAFSGDKEAMRECLTTYFRETRPPEQFARRCLAAVFYTSSMALLWPKFLTHSEGGSIEGSIVAELTRSLFPPELFGPPE